MAFRNGKRTLCILLAASLALGCAPGASAVIGDGVAPTYDEAYYATTDYYGNLTSGSVVKSYILNGAGSLTDYGTYEEVINLSDGSAPSSADGSVTFRFGKDAPSHFYFEGKTAEPFGALPWTLAVHYSLNGVPTKAEDLAGKTGMVELTIDATPNEDASEYARNNYVLVASAVFNQDDILSLEAPGAQVQLIGNLRAVLFIAFPGEEQQFVIRVGAEDFSFGGMTFLLMPATLSQLEEISRIKEKKEDLEDSYHKLSDSLDDLLDSVSDLQGSLYASASGLDTLNQARGTFAEGKGVIYDGADLLQVDMEGLAALLDPVAEQAQAVSKSITDGKEALNPLVDTMLDLRDGLEELDSVLRELEETLKGVRKDAKDVKLLIEDIKAMKSSLNQLRNALNHAQVSVHINTSGYSSAINSLETMTALYYASAAESTFYQALLVSQGKSTSEAAQIAGLFAMGRDAVLAASPESAGTYDKLNALYHAVAGSGSFQEFVTKFLIAQGYGETAAKKSADELTTLFNVAQSDPGALSLISSSASSISSDLDYMMGEVNEAITEVAEPAAVVVGKLADLCDRLDGLIYLMDDLSDLGDGAAEVSATLRDSLSDLELILEEVDDLRVVANDFEPTAQEVLKTLEDLSVQAAASIRDVNTLTANAEALLRTAGDQLNEGTRQTLNGLSSTLRKAAGGIDATDSLREAKDSVTGLIEDTWDDYTGDINNLLLMDAEAEIQSLTSGENPAPRSIQILIRTQEIEVVEEDEEEAAAAQKEQTTFLGRVAQMFKDFWRAITGLFQR